MSYWICKLIGLIGRALPAAVAGARRSGARGIVTRRLERMPYGLTEFEITDPDGYVICLSQLIEDASDLPTPAG